MQILALLLLGLAAGGLSGFIGIGGGIVIVPALVLLFGLDQHVAQGTALAILVPPIGLLAAWTYYKHGFVDYRIALLVCAGFILGSFFSSRYAVHLPTTLLSRVFAVSIIVIGVRMLFSR